MATRWRLVAIRWRLVANRWRLLAIRWRLIGTRWCLVAIRWRLVAYRLQRCSGHRYLPPPLAAGQPSAGVPARNLVVKVTLYTTYNKIL